jgi:diguanylate cyclase (GGDEF)-like protein
MPPIKREWYEITREVILEAQEKINASLINPLFGELPAISVQDFSGNFFENMRGLVELATDISSAPSAPSSEELILKSNLIPVFKALFLQARLAKAREFGQQRARTTNPDVIATLESKLKVYDAVIREEWFQKTAPEYPPSLRDMLTLERVEKLDVGTQFPERQYDEKFHILQARNLFYQDLHYYRAKCEMRGISVAIAFIDIDDFKKNFNTPFGETHVDLYVLPVFMRALEAHIYGHGHAYCYGGDEYALLMPNTDADLAMEFIQRLRRRIAKLVFHATDKTITVSAGLCVADWDCHLTDEELLGKAERAKNFAKEKGKDQIAGYVGTLFDEAEVRVLTPVAPSSA